MKTRFSTIVVALAIFAALECSVQAQTTAQQGFKVVVPSSISITAPTTAQMITHDQSNNNQPFPIQNWTVKGNVLNGVNVSFATSTAFVHNTNNSHKRNVQLGLAVNSAQGPASWTVTQATDVTDYLHNDEVAAVTARSNGAGRAVFDLSVTFLTENYDLFAAGEYDLVVVGTVAAN